MSDFAKLVRAMNKHYPPYKESYVDFDVFLRDVMREFVDMCMRECAERME